MERCILTGCMFLACGLLGHAQTTFGPGPGEAYGFATPTGHGGAATPYIFTSSIFANVPQGWTVAGINSLTIHDLSTTSAEGLTFALSNDTHIAVIVQGADSSANLNGDYTFVNDPSLPTIRDVSAGLGSNDLIAPGTYRMEGGILIFGNAGNMEDWTHFEGTTVWPGWDLILLNQSTSHAGTFGGWTMNVSVNAVPEPAAWATLALGLGILRRFSRKTCR